MDDLVPGRYRLTKLLGRGGMGEVYLADDLVLGREVAIKLVAEERMADPDARRRLLKEARAAATLDHPGICAVYDSGETSDGRAYVVMQYVEGQTLAAHLERGTVSVRDALGITAQIAGALASAHSRGLVHRDVKPSNVILTPSGSPKLLDLGIAKAVGVPRELSDASTASTATAPGALVGTPAYMSPEQVQQRPVDGRSDLFSLGAVLYEGLTGRRAFEGPTAFETLANVLHQDPPAPSSVRRELSDRHDALCERLLAKDPADRFQSANEVVGAIRLLLDAPSTASRRLASPAEAGGIRRPKRTAAALLISALLILAALGTWLWTGSGRLPPVPPEASRWYDRGTEAIREGAYITGRKALEQAIEVFPQHVLAYARLAEADSELGDERSAQRRLVRVASLVSDESMLPDVERLRLRAVRALVLRDVDGAVTAYRDLVSRRPEDPGVWLDLGRAQEAADLRGDAQASYEQAIRRDRQYAAAHLRRGDLHRLESNRAEALAAFAEAERLYRAASDSEGETEVLIRRGLMLDAFGDLKEARKNLERALALATGDGRTYQQVRTRAALASVTASEGRFAEAERIASTAVQEAIASELDIVAADGLIDLASIMGDRPDAATAHLQQALQLAERRGARRTTARALLQQAAVYEEAGRPRDALALVNQVLPFFKTNRYRRFELLAGSIAARAHQSLDELELARQVSRDVLTVATTVRDEAQEALAVSNLASVTAALGDYPEALRLRDRAVAIHRRQGDQASLPYDVANRADVLIRLGRTADAGKSLAELDAGIAAGLEAYAGRSRRVAFLRGLSALTALDCDAALASLRRVASFGASAESAAVLAPMAIAFCEARQGLPRGKSGAGAPTSDPTLSREVQYWLALTALERNQPAAALAEASKGLSLLGDLSNDELRWRLAAVGAIAARHLRQEGPHASMSGVARAALARIQSTWKDEYRSYERRADLTDLLKRSGLP